MFTKYISFILLLLIASGLQAQQTVGLFLNDSLAYNGYTLLTASSSRSTYLLDNCGRVAHQWNSENIPYFSSYLTSEGNLLRTARFGVDGGGIELFNWEGDLIWTYLFAGDNFSRHHDIAPLPNGNVLVLAWESFTAQEVIEAGRDTALVDVELRPEFIAELQPIGFDSANIVWEWHAFDHLIQDYDSTKANYGDPAEHPELIDFNFIGLGGSYTDWLHANFIDYNPQLDQIIINLRNFNEFWVIDHSTTTLEAASHAGGNSGKGGDILYRWGNPETYRRGTSNDRVFYWQHNAHWIPSGYPGAGNIMIFNNGLQRQPVEYSSIDVITPPVDAFGHYTMPANNAPYAPADLHSTYTATPPVDMFSQRISSAQRLPNGHTLICVGQTGRLFEVDEAGTVHWDYITPLQGNTIIEQGEPAFANTVFMAEKYSVGFEGFAGRDLTPGEPIEINPLPSDCEITTDIQTAFEMYDITAYPNPTKGEVRITYHLHQATNDAQLELYNYQGQLILKKYLPTNSNEIQINTNNLPSGVYFYHIRNYKKMSRAYKLTVLGS